MVHRFTIGVIIGDEKIMVIDSGLGMTPNLRRYVESIVGTSRPIICAVTQGTREKVGAACLFDEAYCSHEDLSTVEDPFDPIQRYCDLVDYSLESNIVMEYCRKNMISDNHCEMKDVKDGDIFDLGGVKIRAVSIPGTTAGAMAYYNEEDNYCFTGDGVNMDVHLDGLDAEGIANYRDALVRFDGIIRPDTVLYSAHLPQPLNARVVKDLIKIADDILAHRVEQDPPAESVFHGKNNNRGVRGHYYNNACIVYDRNKIGLAGVKLNSDDCCYYSCEKWSDRVYVLVINYSTVNRITLMAFVGDDKVLLIDSGHGMDDKLRPYLESIVGKDKPIYCALTHIGIDHGGGAIQYDKVFIHPNDRVRIPSGLDKMKRLGDVQPFSNYNKEFEGYVDKHILDRIEEEDAIPIEDGYVFDLGGLKVEAIFTPGHSVGHLSYYCAQEKIAFTGDAMNVDTHLKSGMNRNQMLNYANMIQNFMNRVAPDTTLFSAHLNRPNQMRVPRNIQAAALELAAGQTYGDAPGEAIQKHIDAFHNPDIREHYHGDCCIVYKISALDSHPAD